MTTMEVDTFLEHYGVKGMKWGVRRNRRANLHKKVGEGKGGRTDKIRSGLQVGVVDLAKGGSFKGAAARKGARQLARNKRVKAGEGSVKDKLAFYGGSRYQDVFPTGKSSNNTKAAVGASIAGAIVVSAGSQLLRPR